MKKVEITSWNVNGIRAAAKNGLLKWLSYEQPDIFCAQEVKAEVGDLEKVILEPFNKYKSYFHSAQKRGYSGVAVYTKAEPLDVKMGIGIKDIDNEGRVLTLKYPKFSLINTYFPNSQREHTRLGYKLDFCQAIKEYCDSLVRQKQNIVICGDFNIAHQEIDLANPKTNMNNAGFLPQERAWMSQFLGKGYVDTFRHFEKTGGHYTWWSYRPGVREKNIGWRIDYHVVNKGFMGNVEKSFIQPEVFGSDHCPVTIVLKI
ncbi:MAG: exodeoxyribonuclease III [Oligoflexia bacterium]|nr:exodeoxyribonuclease III [Oligoflexia bacterium]